MLVNLVWLALDIEGASRPLLSMGLRNWSGSARLGRPCANVLLLYRKTRNFDEFGELG